MKLKEKKRRVRLRENARASSGGMSPDRRNAAEKSLDVHAQQACYSANPPCEVFSEILGHPLWNPIAVGVGADSSGPLLF